ncbi:Uma2 family endonuclease [Streptomyces sp. HK10]|uniref:Uma2 family endonuclease n=1 Tax=Streptomyces sp. HK10 TaxID=3373255 RepID=UPI003748CA69
MTRTYFSRTARGDAWWAAFLAGEHPEDEPATVPAPAPAPGPVRPPRSRAYGVLAGLGRAEPRMTLSAADCAALEEPAGQWLERGADERQLTGALTAGLPPEVHHPAALARRRLTDRLPPEPAPGPAAAPGPASGPPEPAVLRMAECTVCGVPGRPEAFPGGLCRDCRGLPPAAPAGPPPAEVTSYGPDTGRRDRVDKRDAYAAAGTPVHLLVDRDDHSVTVHCEPEGGTYRSRTTRPYGAVVEIPDPVGITLRTEKLKDYARRARRGHPAGYGWKTARTQPSFLCLNMS